MDFNYVHIYWTCHCGTKNWWITEYINFVTCRGPICKNCESRYRMIHSPIDCLTCHKHCELQNILLISVPFNEWEVRGPATYEAKWLFEKEVSRGVKS
jgi:hypothetical protein